MRELVLIGGGGHAKVVIDILEKQDAYEIVGVIDDATEREELLGYPILGGFEQLLAEGLHGRGIVAVGDNWHRAQIVDRILAARPEFEFGVAVHPSARIARGVHIGSGSVLMAGSVVNTDSVIGSHCIQNTNASIDHDCFIGNFCTIAPGATLGGNVRLGDMSTVSLGAGVIHGIEIGSNTVVGAGAIVLRDLPPFCVAYGTPARCIRERKPQDPYL